MDPTDYQSETYTYTDKPQDIQGLTWRRGTCRDLLVPTALHTIQYYSNMLQGSPDDGLGCALEVRAPTSL